MRRVLMVTLTAAAISLGSAVPIASAGQPNVSCEDVPAQFHPPGFNTGGFANAEEKYAGSENTPSAEHSQSGNAVSQYDIACVRRANALS
jgi:hypothetical protein